MAMVLVGVKKEDDVALCVKSDVFTKHHDRMKRPFVHSNVATPHHTSENRRTIIPGLISFKTQFRVRSLHGMPAFLCLIIARYSNKI